MTAPAYRADGASVAAEAFYALACDPQRSVVVEACAGAGKTWMLVSRILRALLAGAEPQQILAITFTRKAAGEMRERLADWLRDFAHANAQEREQALRQRGMTAQAAAEAAPRLAALHQHLLTSRRRVEIRTFHGWFSQLLQAAPLELLAELGLSPGLELIEDVADLRSDVFRRFHAQVAADDALRADFFSLVRERGRSQVRKWLEAAWARRVEIESADAAGALDDSVPAAASCWPEFAGLAHPSERMRAPRVRELLLGVAAALGAQSGATARKQGAALEQALALSDATQGFAAVRNALLTQKGEPRKGLQSPGLDEALAHVSSIQVAIEQQQAHDDHVRMARLARVLLNQYERLKRQRGLADMADLERCALHLLQDSALSGWVQERLDQRIRHVLIDEFQDTSPLQWRTLHGWLSGYAGAGGGASGQRPLSVFIVGDPKQSIYRFRGADPRVFAAARSFVAEALGGVVLECDHTRRNAPEVLQAVNAVFERAQAAGHFDGFRTHTTGAAEGAPGAVHLPRIERPTREETSAGEPRLWRNSLAAPRYEPEEGLRQQEAAQVAQAVQALIAQGVPPGEIQVLARKRAVLAQAALALQARGVPYVAPEDNPLMASPEVRDLVAVLDVLASPGHDLSLAHALRSPLFGVSDQELLLLSAEAASGGSWWAALLRAQNHTPALHRAAELLRRWADVMHRLPPHDLLDRIVAEGDLMPRLLAVVPAPRRQAAMQSVHALLNMALGLDGARYASIYGFVRALKRRALTVSAGAVPDAVQLLTVHGAKGLEARAVILMDCDAPSAKAETATVLVDWPVDDVAPRRCAFIASEARCPPSLVTLLERERAAREREELNGLYVAMTRARERLVLSAVAPHASANAMSWWALACAASTEWVPDVARTPSTTTKEPVSCLALPTWRPVLGAGVSDRTPKAPDNPLARLGEALHRLLEWATESPALPLPELARAAASAFALPAEAADSLHERAHAVLHSTEARAFFDASQLAWAGNEVTLLDGEAALRLDRLVAFDQAGRRTWWVLDYKLQATPEAVPAYQAQLARYRQLVQRLQPHDAVRAAFITAAGRVVELADAPDER